MNETPKICEVLGVKVGQRFKMRGAVSGFYVDEAGVVRREEDGVCEGLAEICLMINDDDRIIRFPAWTVTEKKDAETIKRMFPNKKVEVCREKSGEVVLIRTETGFREFLALGKADIFPSLLPGNSIDLYEILK